MRDQDCLTTRIILLGVWALILLVPLRATAQQAGGSNSQGKLQNPVPSFRFDSGQGAQKIPFDLSKNLILVKARVNDSPPLWFIFGGASSSVINARLAKELGLRVQGKESFAATGGDIEAELIHGVSLSLPGLKVFDQTVASLPLGFLESVLGRAIGGMIGDDFIRQFVVEIDYGAGTMNIYAPAGYRYSGYGELLPVKFIDGEPVVSAKIKPKGYNSVEGRFKISIGSDGAFIVNAPFVRAHQLLKSVSQTQMGNTGNALGEMSRSFTGRVENIQLGRFSISNPLVTFSQASKGSEARADYDGTLGAEIFRRFKLILDYSRQRIILEANSHLAEPVEADMSGFELVAEGRDFNTLVINEVVPNSPAAEAGLQEEDELIAIAGRPASEIGLERIRQMLKQEGKEYLLSIKRGKKMLQVRMKLRRLI